MHKAASPFKQHIDLLASSRTRGCMYLYGTGRVTISRQKHE